MTMYRRPEKLLAKVEIVVVEWQQFNLKVISAGFISIIYLLELTCAPKCSSFHYEGTFRVFVRL